MATAIEFVHRLPGIQQFDQAEVGIIGERIIFHGKTEPSIRLLGLTEILVHKPGFVHRLGFDVIVRAAEIRRTTPARIENAQF
jgi:hypothetical protein